MQLGYSNETIIVIKVAACLTFLALNWNTGVNLIFGYLKSMSMFPEIFSKFYTQSLQLLVLTIDG